MTPFPGRLRPEVRTALGLHDDDLDAWYRRLDQGVHANETPRRWANHHGGRQRLLDSVAAADRRAVADAVPTDAPLLVVTGHVGPRLVLLDVLRAARPDVVVISANPEAWEPGVRASLAEGSVDVDDVLRLQYLQMYAVLRAGGAGYCAPDGGRGSRTLDTTVLGVRVPVNIEPVALARRTGARAVAMFNRWNGDAITVEVSSPAALDPQNGDEAWVDGYGAWLEAAYRSDAMHWRLPTGSTMRFFEPADELIQWHHAYNRMVAAIRQAGR